MILETAQQLKVLGLSTSHAQFSLAVSGMFSWFQTAVAGYRAEMDFDQEFNKHDVLTADGNIPERLKNEWSSYARALRAAYADFGRDVVTRMGVDEPAQVRNLALSIAGSSFQRARTSAREFLVSQIEATVIPA
ncbi:MAG: hypothetical protein SGJ27_05720 [Candidatus Melainabacteria bacterium]|nr:hypothetical protein [Candidatus Melainabacteria bacterium]